MSELDRDPASEGEDVDAVGHPSQAEGEDPDDTPDGQDADAIGHPSQAEGADTTADGTPE